MTNAWCDALNINTPSLEQVKHHKNANSFTMLMVALLEKGAPMTLDEVAVRFEQAAVAPATRALQSLKRCRPGRPPIYRTDDYYSIDPHDKDADLWMFRLGLRPPKAPKLSIVKPEPAPLPGIEVPLSIAELDEAWKGANLSQWSSKRLTLAVLEAHGRPMYPQEILAFVTAQTKWSSLDMDPAKFRTRVSPVDILPDGRLTIDTQRGTEMIPVRKAVREKIGSVREAASKQTDPAIFKAHYRAAERRKVAEVLASAKKRRAFLYAFPEKRPESLALLDVDNHELSTFIGEELEAVAALLANFDIIGGMDIRPLLTTLGFDFENVALAELGPPQKTKQINKQGRKLKITTELLIQNTCNISRPLGDKNKLASYLAHGQYTRLRRRLEANVKALYAFYEYGRLHGSVRLRWGFLDERIRAPWSGSFGGELHTLEKIAAERALPLEIIVGNAPGWEDPWSRSQLVFPIGTSWSTTLVDENGYEIDRDEIQRARVAGSFDHQGM
ncbi:MAG: hypothetical protein QNK37_14315 [Acidobacteriota bacterium]|nr:hypothetical protein [Acidobacteriota bacterium]